MIPHSTTTFARTLVAVSALSLIAGCSMFGGQSAEERKAADKADRVVMSSLESKLTPDADMATVTVTLPEAAAIADWPQAGGGPTKRVGHVAAAPELKVKWKASIGKGATRAQRIVSGPVVSAGKIYTLDAAQSVRATDLATGKTLWTHRIKGPRKRDQVAVGGGVAVTGDQVIVSSGFGYLMSLDRNTGAVLWSRLTDTPITGAPTVAGTRGFVTGSNNEIFAFDLKDGATVWSDQAIAESARILSAPSPAVDGDMLVAPYSSGELVAYLPANGRRLWVDALTTAGKFTPISAINDIASHPVIENGVVFAVSHSGVLAAIDARSGQRIWAQQFGGVQAPALAGDFLFVVGVDGQVACLSKFDGKVVWAQRLPEYRNVKKRKDRLVWSGPLVAGNRLLVASSQGRLLALSPTTGETLAEIKLGQPIYVSPIAADGVVLVLTENGQLIALR